MASKLYGISARNMRAVEKLFAENARAASAAAPESKRRTMKSLLKAVHRRQTFKVKSLGERAKSIATTHGNPVAQVKALGRMIRKYADYLLRKHNSAETNNAKAMLRNAQENYDIAVSSIQEYLSTKLREIGGAYVMAHGFEGMPQYKKVADPYDDIENMTKVLVEFEKTVQTYAPEMQAPYMEMMRQIVDEMTKVINTSLESAGEKKANNVNELAALFAGL